ncbi:apoptotic chromatin condensation inducer in the nucleus isoform X2 [Cherax quadricarinatus]|uniref:apoptotic chromatin condensation inducer in the nucleus isoform X2 n=1 Tax=Cherax quadricarinatus TaxID=27406 RepID=UPI00237813B5|nr:titin-like isoform X2 [Cherax quadricarinatus]XP_053643499.1 titin-like isoform X2 [Cherax quadricarinatus]
MATTTAPSSCTSSSSRGHPPPDSMDSAKRHLSDAGRQRLSSFPSRQRRMGPAPLASFEDLSMDKTTSDSSPEERTQLPEIGEETSGATTPVTPVATAALSVPTSPSIRVSAASSSSPHETDSKESTPEKELFSGYAKSDFCENMAADLHSSTEELDGDEEEQQRRRRERACKLAELERREEVLRVAELNRKGSSSSVISDGLLPVTSGHSSRLSSLGSIGSTRRSPSPHRMLLETSFCGSRPIQQPSIDFEDPPVSTTRLMDFAIESIERVRSPMEAKPPDIFRTSPSTLPRLKQEEVVATVEVPITKIEVSGIRSAPPSVRVVATTAKKKPPPIEIEVNAEAKKPITTAIPKPPEEHKSTQLPKSPLHIEQTQQLEQTQQQQRQPLSSQSSPRSPRMPKKVAVPQVPDLKDLPRPSPTPSAASSTAAPATTPEYHHARSFSTTPSASPRASRRRRTRDEVESGSSSPSVSRKSSFTNLFRKSDSSVLSPVTPDSPGSSGRKSPFSQFIRSAKKEFRSRSRSRSRSKSRERDLEDDTHDRRSVLSIFRPKTKKKTEADKGKPSADTRAIPADSKLSEAITNVEFTFNDDGKYQSSSFGLIRQESEVNKAIKEPLKGVQVSAEPETPKPEALISSRDSSYNELSSIMTGDNKPSSDAIIVEEAKENGLPEKSEIITDELFEKPSQTSPPPSLPPPSPPPPDIPPPPSIPSEVKENDVDVPEGDKPNLPPKQKDRTSDVELTLEAPAQDQSVDGDSRSESERESEIEYLKRKASQQQGTEESLESPDVENKGLVSQDSLEDGELPYVPTTLPMERPLAAPMIPVKERATTMRHTQSIERPRSTTPLITGRLEEYKQVAGTPEGEPDKIMINIPQTGPPKVLPKRQSSKAWEDFCQEGLKSPRTLRKEYRERSLQSSEDIPPPLPPKVRSPARSPITTPEAVIKPAEVETKSQPEQIKSWINFDEMPDIVLKPVRQIKTVPPRHQAQLRQKDMQERKETPQFKPQTEEQRIQEKTSEEETPTRKLPPSLPEPLHLQDQDSDNGQALSEASTPDKGDNSDHSSDSDKPTSPSSSEDLTTVRERIEEIKKEGDEYENSDLERLLAPVNDCINRLSSLSSEQGLMERRSPIPDNWSDFLLPPQVGRRSRLSSLGSDAGSMGGRSPSPSCMLLETSFCGSHPIDDPAAAEPDVPIAIARKLSGISLGDLSPFTVRDRRDSSSLLTCPDRASILSDSSAEGGGGSPRDCDYYSSRQPQEAPRTIPGAHQLNPFGMDLGVRSNRSSVVSQDQRKLRGDP